MSSKPSKCLPGLLPSLPNLLTPLTFTRQCSLVLSPICENLHQHDISFSLHICVSLGVEAKLDNLNQLKVKGLVLGPLHTVQTDRPDTLNLQEVTPTQGDKEALISVIEKAERKGRSSFKNLKSTQMLPDSYRIQYYSVKKAQVPLLFSACFCFTLPFRHLCGARPDSKLPGICSLVHRS